MNILVDKLPIEVNILGVDFPINSDFSASILFTIMMEDNNLTEEEKIEESIKIYFGDKADFIFENNDSVIKALEKIKWFYRCGSKDNNTSKGNNNPLAENKCIDYEKDANYIFSSFYTQYNINLTKEKLHWWEFKALFDGLNDDSLIKKIISYRITPLSKVPKHQKEFFSNMKKKYALKEKTIKRTEEERDRIANLFNL